MEEIIIDKNLQFLDDITELGNLNGNGVSWREKKHVLELTLTAGDDDDSDMLEMEVVGVVKPDLLLMFSFNLLIINSTLFI